MIAVVLVDFGWNYVAHRIMPDLTPQGALEMSRTEADALVQAVRVQFGFPATHGAFAEFEGEFAPDKALPLVRAFAMEDAGPKPRYTS